MYNVRYNHTNILSIHIMQQFYVFFEKLKINKRDFTYQYNTGDGCYTDKAYAHLSAQQWLFQKEFF